MILLYLDPGQFPALPAQLIAETSKLFLLDQKLFSRLEPFLLRYDLVFSPQISRFRHRCICAHVFLSLADPATPSASRSPGGRGVCDHDLTPFGRRTARTFPLA